MFHHGKISNFGFQMIKAYVFQEHSCSKCVITMIYHVFDGINGVKMWKNAIFLNFSTLEAHISKQKIFRDMGGIAKFSYKFLLLREVYEFEKAWASFLLFDDMCRSDL